VNQVNSFSIVEFKFYFESMFYEGNLDNHKYSGFLLS
jgi:hypothetical protein